MEHGVFDAIDDGREEGDGRWEMAFAASEDILDKLADEALDAQADPAGRAAGSVITRTGSSHKVYLTRS